MSRTVAGKTSKTRTSHQRAYSASECVSPKYLIVSRTKHITLSHRLARNTHNFETWSTYQHCEQASLSDLPDGFKNDITQLFHMKGCISQLWIDKVKLNVASDQYIGDLHY